MLVFLAKNLLRQGGKINNRGGEGRGEGGTSKTSSRSRTPREKQSSTSPSILKSRAPDCTPEGRVGLAESSREKEGCPLQSAGDRGTAVHLQQICSANRLRPVDARAVPLWNTKSREEKVLGEDTRASSGSRCITGPQETG